MDVTWKERVTNWLVPRPGGSSTANQLSPGMYHYQRERDGGYMRFHLRVELSGEALLIAGASEVARLSIAGAEAAKRLLETDDEAGLLASVANVGTQQLYREVSSLLNELGGSSSRFPIFNLPDPVDSTRDARLIAPCQADVEIGEGDKLRAILKRLWEAGITHVRLLSNDAVTTQQLVHTVEQAEDIGMIAGVRALARWLADDERIKQLADVGLDYVLCPWGVTDELHGQLFGDRDLAALPAILQQIHEREMTPVIEIPLVAGTVDALSESMQHLIDWRVTHIECFALVGADKQTSSADSIAVLAPAELRQVAALIEELPDEHPLQAIWLPPLACHNDESIRDRVRQGPRAGGDVTIRVDANGDVFPPRGKRQRVGNLLEESWDDIWKDAVFRRFREYVEANTRCDQCPGLAICAADCPSDPIGWADEG